MGTLPQSRDGPRGQVGERSVGSITCRGFHNNSAVDLGFALLFVTAVCLQGYLRSVTGHSSAPGGQRPSRPCCALQAQAPGGLAGGSSSSTHVRCPGLAVLSDWFGPPHNMEMEMHLQGSRVTERSK